MGWGAVVRWHGRGAATGDTGTRRGAEGMREGASAGAGPGCTTAVAQPDDWDAATGREMLGRRSHPRTSPRPRIVRKTGPPNALGKKTSKEKTREDIRKRKEKQRAV